MESTWLELGQGQCGKAKCPYEGRQTTVVKYYKGERLMRSRCRSCDLRGWTRAADLQAYVGGGVHD